MKVNVIGKEFVSGTSRKTGKEFASNVVYVTYKKPTVNGLAVDTIWLNPESYPLDSIQVNKAYDIDRDSRGFIIGFDPV